MRKIYLTDILLFLLLACSLTGCSKTDAARKETLPTFSCQLVLDTMEQALRKGETEFQMVYTYTPGLKEKITKTVKEHFQDRYLMQCLLKDVSIKYNQTRDVLAVDYKMSYIDAYEGCKAVYTINNIEDLEDLFTEGYLKHWKITAVLLKENTISDAQIFDCMNSAEVNCSLMAYEATELTYSIFPPRTGEKLILTWASFPADEEVLQARQDELYQAAVNAASHISQAENSGGLYKAVYDFLLEHVEYDETLSQATLMGPEYVTADMHRQRSAYGALVDRKTVCTGYARAFQALCGQLGLPCYTLLGEYNGTKHCWNAVYIDGERRYIDCTLADTGTPEVDTFLFDEEQKKALGYVEDEYFGDGVK